MKVYYEGFNKMVRDDEKGVTYTFSGGKVTKVTWDVDKCPHQRMFIVYDDADGRNYHCEHCGSLLDEFGNILERGDASVSF